MITKEKLFIKMPFKSLNNSEQKMLLFLAISKIYYFIGVQTKLSFCIIIIIIIIPFIIIIIPYIILLTFILFYYHFNPYYNLYYIIIKKFRGISFGLNVD
jgi:hypothetical protein